MQFPQAVPLLKAGHEFHHPGGITLLPVDAFEYGQAQPLRIVKAGLQLIGVVR